MRKLLYGFLATALVAALPLAANAAVVISVSLVPPALPVYVQPAMPGPGYLWTPGYWAWNGAGYYWVPGTWVLAPSPGLLWTPGYWGWVNGAYIWHGGYWGPHVGFYGGINYGFGYGGVGFHGGYWQGGRFVVNPGVAHELPATHVAFNGGVGGVVARPTPGELIAERDRHIAFTHAQLDHQQAASRNDSMRAAVNGGRPMIAATPRAGVFTGAGVVASHGSYHAAAPAAHTPPQAYHNPGAPAGGNGGEHGGGGGYGHEGHGAEGHGEPHTGEGHQEHLR
jgi:hypothetical protein